MPDKVKIFSVSIMAMSVIADFEGTGPGTYVEHLPGLQPAPSMEEAIKKAREHALQRWPEDQGWFNHQAVAVEVTGDFYLLAEAMRRAGVIDL